MANEYLDFLEQQESERQQAQSAGIAAASTLTYGVNPDAAANARKTAGFLGVPAAAVEATPEEFERQARVKKLDADTAQAPTLRQRYTDADFHKLASDDSGVLSGIESVVRRLMGGSKKLPAADPAVMTGREYSAAVRRLVGTGLDPDTARALAMQGTTIENQAPLMGESRGPAPSVSSVLGGIFNAERFRASSQGASVAAADLLGLDNSTALRKYRIAKSRAELADPAFETSTGQGLYSGGVSLVQNAPGLALSIITGNPLPALAMMGGQVGAESYGKFRERGASGGQAALGGILEGGIEIATEMLPMGFLVNKLGKAGAGEFLKGLLARELPTEQIATLAQDAVDTAIANPNKTWGDYVRERPEAAYQTLLATLTQTGAMGALHVAAGKVLPEREQAARAEETAAELQQLADLMATSKLRERAPDSFNQFMAQITESGEAPTELYIDAEVLANTLNQSAITIEELRAIAPSVAAQLDAAAFVPGADVRVPVAEFAAAGPEITTALLDHLREAPDAMSRAEAQEYVKAEGEKIRADVEQQLAEREDATAFRDQVKQATAQFQQQLDAAGKFQPKVNEAYATLLGNFYATQALRAGVPLADMLQRYGLQVTSKDAGGGQRLDQGKVSLNDDGTFLTAESPAGKVGGIVKDGALRITHAEVEEAQRGTGQGKALYRQLVDDALARGLRVFSDFTVAADAVRVYESLTRAGYDVQRLDGGALEDGAVFGEGAKSPAYEVVSGPKTLEQPAYHGSPHQFDKFSLDKIGSGEGAQAFGWGLYFTEEKAIAEVYRKKLSDSSPASAAFVNGERIAPSTPEHHGASLLFFNDNREIKALAKQWLKEFDGNPGMADTAQKAGLSPDEYWKRLNDFVQAHKRKDITIAKGQTYEVEVPDDEKLMLWDKPMTSQPAFVKEKLQAAGVLKEFKDNMSDFASPMDTRGKGKGENLYNYLAWKMGGAKQASEFLNGLGIPGHKFRQNTLTGNAGKGFNFVIWNEDAVKMLRTLYQEQQGGQPARGALSFGADITASPSVIALLEGADLSTFIHESGHFFLEVQADLAARIQTQISGGASVSEAERGIVADMEKILTWFGITATPEGSALDRWSQMTLEEKREHHEQWARGFEKYVAEGKAPSQELQTLFARFRAWLVSVYKTLTNLNVTLTDDVRSVMDRMLASDTAIADAQAARAMGPLFQTPEQAGMTPEEYADYQALAERATAGASADLDARMLRDMKWLSRARDKALKARQAEVDELRKEIEREIRPEVMSQPVYVAWQFLTGKNFRVEPGIQAAETIDLEKQSGKLRTSLLKQTHPEEWKTLSERRMTSEDNGMDPDIVADVVGFSSGDEMVKALAAAPSPQTVIEELTDAQMLQRHGDIASPQALAQAADEAVHNELRARVIASELKALQQANTVTQKQGRSTVDVMAKTARDYAYQIIARQRVRDLRPGQYTAAEARSARLAQQAMGKDAAEAAMHKRNQLVNNYAAKAAFDAQAEVKAARDYFKRFDRRSKGIAGDYQDQIEQLLESVELRQISLKEIDRRKSFAQWYAEQQEAGNEPSVPPELLDASRRKSYKDMTVEEIRGLRDTIKQIEHQGRLKNKLLLARDQREFNAIATEMAGSIVANGGQARPVELEGPNPVTDWFAGVAASHRKLASLFRQMDGNRDNGPMWEHIGRAMNERGTMEDVMVEKATMALRELYAPLLKMRGGITGHRSKVFIPEIGASLTRGGRLAVALNWGNEANRQRIMDGDQWSVGQVQEILKTLSPAELEFVNGVWEYIDSYWPEIAAKERRLTGVEPEKVEALPFTAVASDGSAVQMRGGYYPLKYDTDRSDRADTQEAALAAKEMMQGVITKATTRRGHTKERLKEVKRAVRKDLNVITQHVTQVVHDLAWHEWLIDTNKILSDDAIVDAIRGHYGPKVLKTMRDDVLGIATADVKPQSDIDTALMHLRGNVTRATMGASLTTAFLQPFGLTQSIVRIGGRHVLRGMARWGGDAAKMENTLEWIRGKSDFMRLRAKTFNRELREIRGSVAGKSRTMQMVDGGLFALMQKMQLVADVPTWVGQYEKSLSEGLDDAAAVAMADRAVLESQGGGATKDLAEVQRKHPMLTQFYSYFSVTLNLAAEQTAATDFKNPAAVAGWLGDMALLMVLPAILPSLIMFALKGGDDDEKGMARRIAEWQLGYLMGTVVGLRELSGAVGGFDYAGPPVGRLVADIGKAGKQIMQGELDEPAVMSLINLMGSAFGIPTVQALRSYRGWKAWQEGKEGAGPQSVLFGPPPKD
jgi:ribosomal protein S18 acetylase RimI-like enzyme